MPVSGRQKPKYHLQILGIDGKELTIFETGEQIL